MSAKPVEQLQLCLDTIASNTAKSVECIHNGVSYNHIVEEIKNAFQEAYEVIEKLPNDIDIEPMDLDLDSLYTKAKDNVQRIACKILKEKCNVTEE